MKYNELHAAEYTRDAVAKTFGDSPLMQRFTLSTGYGLDIKGRRIYIFALWF